MNRNHSTFLNIDSKILEKNLTIEECKPAGLEGYKALFGIDDDDGNKAPWKLVTPKPGLCVKTQDANGRKTFVNICTLEEVPEPKDVDEEALLELIESQSASDYRVPLSLQEPRDTTDKAGNPAVCYDVAINPRFLNKVESSQVFKLFLLQVSFDGLKDKFDVDLDIEGYTVLSNKRCMGNLVPHRIRIASPSPATKKLVEELEIMRQRNVKDTPADKVVTNYRLIQVHREGKDYLYGEIHVPRVMFAKDLVLGVGVDRIAVDSSRGDSILDINIPFSIVPDSTYSQFSMKTKVLHFISPFHNPM